MRVPPPEVLATWPAPNYVDPETRGPTLLIAELTIMPLAFVVLALRLYCRIIKVRNSGWDDWLMVIAMVRIQEEHEIKCLTQPSSSVLMLRFASFLPTSFTDGAYMSGI